MIYATEGDIVAMYGAEKLAIVADANFDGVPDAERVQAALVQASAEIDTHIGTVHKLPLHAIPEILKTWCIDIAIYRMANRAAQQTEEMRQRRDDAIKALMRIAEGKQELVLPPDPNADPTAPAAGQGPNPVVIEGPERIFSRDKLRDL
ncbi:MAG: DUF1320 domain-containing protein [Pseudomonadota bacterium]